MQVHSRQSDLDRISDNNRKTPVDVGGDREKTYC